MKKTLTYLLLSLSLVLLGGCIEKPQTPREGIAAGYVMVESLSRATAIALRDGYINADECNKTLDRLQSAQNLLVEAQRLEGAEDHDKALVTLRVAQVILREVSQELKR